MSSPRQRQARATIQRQQELADLRELLALPAGQRVLWRALGRAGIFRSSFSSDPQQMAHAEGVRSLGLWLTAELEAAAPGASYRLMLAATNTPTEEATSVRDDSDAAE